MVGVARHYSGCQDLWGFTTVSNSLDCCDHSVDLSGEEQSRLSVSDWLGYFYREK
jgi:hypothetical protein